MTVIFARYLSLEKVAVGSIMSRAWHSLLGV